jgi:signal peptidase I
MNCGFQNMPGTEVCGRCTTSLGLATAVMDVHPPRASRMAKRARRALPIKKAWFRTRDALHADDVSARLRHASGSLPSFPIFARLIIPGWSHFFLKQRLRGQLFFWGFVACLLPSFLMYGSTWGGIWFGLAFSVHSSAALVTQTFADAGVRDRIARSIVVSILLWVLVYWPCTWLFGGFAQPHTVETSIAPFQVGDVILVNRWEAPKRGDVVLYEVNYSTTGHPAGHERLINLYGGESIDRILAVPGDLVECESGHLLINGLPSTWRPLNPGRFPRQFRSKMSPGQYLVLPSGAPGLAGLEDVNLWQTTGNISRENIVGRAFLQSSPLSRIHFIR